MKTFEEIGLEVNDKGVHTGDISYNDLRELSDKDLQALSMERTGNKRNKYTNIAIRAQYVYQERKGGMHSAAHYRRDMTPVAII